MSKSSFGPRPGITVAAATILTLSPLAASALAAEANANAAAAASSGDDTSAVAELVVTVRKREEKLQDVPISVSAVNGSVLKVERLDHVSDYAAKIANFAALQQNTRVSTLTVRGLGGNANSDGSEAGVGLIVDNVFFTHPGFAWLDFVDLENVQLARGPQGTLLGKNTTLGALVITTQKPSFTPEAEVDVTAANRDRYEVRANVSGPLSTGDRVAGRLTYYRDVGGGYVTNQYDGKSYLGADRWALRGQLLFEGDAISDRLIVEHYNTQEYNNFYPAIGDPTTYADGSARNGWAARLKSAFGYTPSYDPWNNADVDTQQKIVSRTTGVSNQADWRVGGFTVTSVSAWRRLYFRPDNDSDGTPYPIDSAGYDLDVNQYSQELRIASPTGGRIDYQGGLYVLRETVTSNYRTKFLADASAFFLSPSLPSLVLNGVEIDQLGRADTTSVAGFGQAVWHVSDKASLTTGLRYTWERREASNDDFYFGGTALTGALAAYASYRTAVTGAPYVVQGSKDSGAVSWLVNPAYKITPDVLAYANFAYGEKSGAANLGAKLGDPIIIKPEKSMDYELGLKTTLLGGRATLNGDLYWNDIFDYQATLIDPSGTTSHSYLANVGHVRLRGVEVEGRARVTDALSLSFSAAYNDARYVSYKNAPPPVEDTYVGARTSVDLSGTRVPLSPRLTGQVSADYQQPISERFTLIAYANETWRSATFLNVMSTYGRQGAYGLTNAGLGLKTADGRYQVTVWSRNLFDKRYAAAYSTATAYTPYIAILGEPRTFGVTLTAKVR